MMNKAQKEIPGVTNRDLFALRKEKWGKKPRIMFLFLWFVSTGSAYFYHPHLQTIEAAGLKLALSFLGIFTWPLWIFAAPFWERVQVGATSIQEDSFFNLYYGSAVLVPIVIWLFWQYRLSRPVTKRRSDEFKIESHRVAVGRLTPAEALAQFELKDGIGMPLISLAPEPENRAKKMLGLNPPNSHTGIFAPTGAGKGMHLTEMILATPSAMVIIDPKGEQLARTGGYRAKLGPVYTLPGNGIDLSRYYDFEDRDDVAELHLHMMKPWQDSQPIFADKVKSLFSAVGIFAKKYSLNPMEVLLSLAESDPSVSLKALSEVAPDLVAAFSNGSEPGHMDRMAASSWGTFTTRLYNYWQHVETITEEGPLSIPDDWVEQKATIYITYRFDQLKGVNGVISAVLAGLMRDRIKKDSKVPMMVAVDELAAVGLGNVDNYLATVRSYGISLVLYIQDYAQLVENYGDRASSIVANCANKVWYPAQDPNTAKMMEEVYGTELKSSYTHSKSLQRERLELDMGKKESSLSQRLEIVPALRADEITSLPADDVICQMGGKVIRGYRLWPVPKFNELEKYLKPPMIKSNGKSQPAIDWREFVTDVDEGDEGDEFFIESDRTPKERKFRG